MQWELSDERIIPTTGERGFREEGTFELAFEG